jgi:hypothetical protein
MREAFFDRAVEALVSGALDVAELRFAQAAALPGDPVRSAVATSFGERVRRLRVEKDRAAAKAAASPKERETSGRVPLLGTTTLLGLGLYGWTLPETLNVDGGGRPYIGLYMLTAGSAFVVPYFLTRGKTVTPGQANLSFYGGTRGMYHGVLLSALVGGNLGPNAQYRLWTGSLLAGSLVELWAGYQLASRLGMTAGQARTIAVGGDFGLGFGFAMGALAGLHHTDHSDDARARGMAATGFFGAAAGMGAGYLLGQRRNNTWGDGEVMRASGLLGLWMGATANYLLDWDPRESSGSDKAFFATLMLPTMGGLVAGDVLVKDANFSVGQSLLVDLSMVAGGLGGAGITYLVVGDSVDSLDPFFISSAAGALLGFGVSAWAFRDTAEGKSVAWLSRKLAAPQVAVLPLIGRAGERGVAVGGMF